VLLSGNITNYFQLISQFTERYKEYSFRNLIQSVLNVLIIIVLYALYINDIYVIDFELYLFLIVGINIALTVWYIITYRDIVFGHILEKPLKKDIVEIYKLGFPLIFAGLVSQLILNLDRQFVSIIYSTEDYAIYAFAYNLLSLVTTFITAISTVLYPSLKRLDEENAKSIYSKTLSVILIITSIFMILYFLIVIVVNYFLPKYIDSLSYVYVIFPTVLLTSSINVVIHNYYKILNHEMSYFIISIVILLMSFVANLIAYFIFKSMIAISVASVICMVIWFFILQFYLKKYFKFSLIKNTIFTFCIFALFYLVNYFIKNIMFSSMLFIGSIILLIIIFFYKEIKNTFKKKEV